MGTIEKGKMTESHKIGNLSRRTADKLIKKAENLGVSTDKIRILALNKYDVTFYCNTETLKKIR